VTHTPARSASEAPPGNESYAPDRDRRSVADSKRATNRNRGDKGNNPQQKRTERG